MFGEKNPPLPSSLSLNNNNNKNCELILCVHFSPLNPEQFHSSINQIVVFLIKKKVSLSHIYSKYWFIWNTCILCKIYFYIKYLWILYRNNIFYNFEIAEKNKPTMMMMMTMMTTPLTLSMWLDMVIIISDIQYDSIRIFFLCVFKHIFIDIWIVWSADKFVLYVNVGNCEKRKMLIIC
mgnify:CR=1 FL=1